MLPARRRSRTIRDLTYLAVPRCLDTNNFDTARTWLEAHCTGLRVSCSDAVKLRVHKQPKPRPGRRVRMQLGRPPRRRGVCGVGEPARLDSMVPDLRNDSCGYPGLDGSAQQAHMVRLEAGTLSHGTVQTSRKVHDCDSAVSACRPVPEGLRVPPPVEHADHQRLGGPHCVREPEVLRLPHVRHAVRAASQVRQKIAVRPQVHAISHRQVHQVECWMRLKMHGRCRLISNPHMRCARACIVRQPAVQAKVSGLAFAEPQDALAPANSDTRITTTNAPKHDSRNSGCMHDQLGRSQTCSG